MPCQITSATGKTLILQINPTNVHVENRVETLPWRSIRGGFYNPVLGSQPERITMRIQAPAKRGSFPGTFTVDSERSKSPVVDRWNDPADYVHTLQDIMRNERARAFVNFPEADIFNWYLIVGLEEDHEGGYGDLPIQLHLELDVRIPLLTQADQTGQDRGQNNIFGQGGGPPPPQVVDPVGQVAPDGTAQPGQRYTTKSGDTLQSIAAMAFGDESRYIDIFNANAGGKGGLVSSDPTTVIEGVTLRIPE